MAYPFLFSDLVYCYPAAGSVLPALWCVLAPPLMVRFGPTPGAIRPHLFGAFRPQAWCVCTPVRFDPGAILPHLFVRSCPTFFGAFMPRCDHTPPKGFAREQSQTLAQVLCFCRPLSPGQGSRCRFRGTHPDKTGPRTPARSARTLLQE